MIERELKPNGNCGSKLITLPKSVVAMAGFEKVDKVNVEVKNGTIIIRKGDKHGEN